MKFAIVFSCETAVQLPYCGGFIRIIIYIIAFLPFQGIDLF